MSDSINKHQQKLGQQGGTIKQQGQQGRHHQTEQNLQSAEGKPTVATPSKKLS
jgi:biotin operon repressor